MAFVSKLNKQDISSVEFDSSTINCCDFRLSYVKKSLI